MAIDGSLGGGSLASDGDGDGGGRPTHRSTTAERMAARAQSSAPMPSVGTVLPGLVASVVEYGAFVQLRHGGHVGLVHISQLSSERGAAVSDVLRVGQRVWVRVLANDRGRLALSTRDIDQSSGRAIPKATAVGVAPRVEELEQLRCVSFSYARSKGAGGQNVNKLDTKCQLRLSLDPRVCPWPAGVRERLGAGSGVGSGKLELLISSQAHRTQAANRRDALEKLQAKVSAAWRPPKVRRQRSGPSAKGHARRLDAKKAKSAVKRSRADAKRGRRGGMMYE